LIYFYETSAVYDKYHKEIWFILEETATNLGYKSCFEFLNNVKGGENVYNDHSFKNLIVWIIVKAIAQNLIDELENEYENENENKES
jgi:prophage antirepressor-like protein